MKYQWRFFRQKNRVSNLSQKIIPMENSVPEIPSRRWINIDYTRTRACVDGRWVDVVCGPLLSKNKMDVVCDKLRKSSMPLPEEPYEVQCPVCLEVIENNHTEDDSKPDGVLVLECDHPMHEECFRKMIEYGYSKCSLCRKPINLKLK